MVRFNPRLHLNKVIASKEELKRYKENKKLICQTLVKKHTFLDL